MLCFYIVDFRFFGVQWFGDLAGYHDISVLGNEGISLERPMENTLVQVGYHGDSYQ
jgi:hypothetical protein